MPWWVEVLQAAEAWGIPPWKLEEEAPDIWMERRLLWVSARNERANSGRPAVGEVRQVGNKRIKRLI